VIFKFNSRRLQSESSYISSKNLNLLKKSGLHMFSFLFCVYLGYFGLKCSCALFIRKQNFVKDFIIYNVCELCYWLN
jgi:hypothetical protein